MLELYQISWVVHCLGQKWITFKREWHQNIYLLFPLSRYHILLYFQASIYYMYRQTPLFQNKMSAPTALLVLGDVTEPVMCLCISSVRGGHVYMSVGTRVQLLRLETSVRPDSNVHWDTATKGYDCKIVHWQIKGL